MPTPTIPTQSQYDAIAAAAQKNGISTALALAVANQESGFNQGAVSPAGAIGEFQLTKPTAAGLGVDPYNEAQNIAGGSAYIRQMLDQFGGNETTALTAYNAGPGNVSSLGVAGAQALPGADPNYATNIEKAEQYYATAYNLTPQQNYAAGAQTATGFAALGVALNRAAGQVAQGPLQQAAAQQKARSSSGLYAQLEQQVLTIGIILILIAGGIFLMAPKDELLAAAA